MSEIRNYPASVNLPTQPSSVIQTLRASRKNVLSVVPKASTTQQILSGRTVQRWHMIMAPDALRRVLVENVENYPKSDVTKAVLRPAIGDSLFVVDGADWRWQRRVIAPAFSRRNVASLTRFATLSAEQICQRIARASGAVDLHKEFVRTTFDVITNVAFSGKAEFDVDHLHATFDSYVSSVGKATFFDLLGLPRWIPRPGGRTVARAVAEMQQITDRLIDDRAGEATREESDLMGLLLGAQDPETGRSMTRKELRDNLLTFIMAGHETTALSLSWACYLCGFDEEVQERARQEAQSVLQGRIATAEDLPALKYCKQVMEETLRLYPSAALVSRTAQRADTLCGRKVLRGDTVIIPIYSIQRHEDYWDDPDQFDPDRFIDRKQIKRFTYLPFGDGPRVCIGASFAVDEAVIILATLLSRYRLRAVPGKIPYPSLSLTLRPQGGVWMTAEPWTK